MSHFQIAVYSQAADYVDLEECISVIESSGVGVVRKTRFRTHDSLIGFNVDIREVPKETESQWMETISGVVDDWHVDLALRFRFKDWSY